MSPPRTASVPRLQRWIEQQRWYAQGDEPPAIVEVQRVDLPTQPAITVVILTTADGQRYQLVQGDSTPDRADQPKAATALARFVAEAGASGPSGTAGPAVEARWVDPEALGDRVARSLGADQSNTSVAVGGTHVLKVLRHLQPGEHPEVEVGRHLLGAPGAPVAALAGWYELVEASGTTVLGVAHRLVPGALDGWALVLSALAADPSGILERLRTLGAAVADLHAALARPGPGFGTQPLAATAVWALGDAVLTDPLLPADAHHAVARATAAIGDDTGAAIRTHGDLHLGQTLVGPDGWVILDFEGEPTRTLEERAQHRSPLRDVAGMLRSLAYAAAAHRRTAGTTLSDGWEPAARAALLDGYLTTIDPALVPGSAATTSRLLALFELEKVLYEIAYERAHRPDWEAIPRAGLAAVLTRVAR